MLLAALLALAGCTAREPLVLPSRACPPLPLLAERPTSSQRSAWQTEVIALYVQCAKGKQ